MDIKGIVANAVLPLFVSAGKEAGVEFLDKLQADKPEWHKTAVIVGHRLVTAHLEEIVDKTTTEYDDKAVEAVVSILETSGKKYGIVLQ